VTGPRDVIGNHPVGALNEDLRIACLAAGDNFAASMPRIAKRHTWEASARAFVENITNVRAEEPKSERYNSR